MLLQKLIQDPPNSFMDWCTGIALGRTTYGCPPPFRSIGFELQIIETRPGETLRSHSANEFIFIHEITEGIQLYIKILTDFFKQ
jgi:acetylornithine deacetylase